MCAWSCVIFEERFMLCFEVVGEFLNVEIYVFGVFFAYVYTKLGISHIEVAKRHCNEKMY